MLPMSSLGFQRGYLANCLAGFRPNELTNLNSVETSRNSLSQKSRNSRPISVLFINDGNISCGSRVYLISGHSFGVQ